MDAPPRGRDGNGDIWAAPLASAIKTLLYDVEQGLSFKDSMQSYSYVKSTIISFDSGMRLFL
jgi:hypothetical protein